MGEKTYNKLVRDKIPEVLTEHGVLGDFEELADEQFRLALLDKLVEEAKELRESEGDMGERADVAEVLKSIDEVFGFTPEKVEKSREKKLSERGGFEKKLFLKTTTE